MVLDFLKKLMKKTIIFISGSALAGFLLTAQVQAQQTQDLKDAIMADEMSDFPSDLLAYNMPQDSNASDQSRLVTANEVVKNRRNAQTVLFARADRNIGMPNENSGQIREAVDLRGVNPVEATADSEDRIQNLRSDIQSHFVVLSQDKVVIVQPNDTLWGYTQKYPDTTIDQWVDINGIKDMHTIYVGETLVNPAKVNSSDVYPRSRSQKWQRMAISPTKEPVNSVLTRLTAPNEVKASWKTLVEKDKGTQINVNWGTYLNEGTFGAKNGKTGYKGPLFALWTENNSGSYKISPTESATYWLTEKEEGNSYQYYVLIRFDKCMNIGWMNFSIPKEPILEKERPAIEAKVEQNIECPPCETKIVYQTTPVPKEQPKPRPNWHGFTELNSSTAKSYNSGSVNDGQMVMGGVRYEKAFPVKGINKIGLVVDAGPQIKYQTAQNITANKGARVYAAVKPHVKLGDLRSKGGEIEVIGEGNIGPYKGVWEQIGVTATYSSLFYDRVYIMGGYGDYFFNSNDLHSEGEFVTVFGRLGWMWRGGTILTGIRADISLFKNDEIAVQLTPWKKFPIGAFMKVDFTENLYVDSSIWKADEKTTNKVDGTIGQDHNLQFNVNIGYLIKF